MPGGCSRSTATKNCLIPSSVNLEFNFNSKQAKKTQHELSSGSVGNENDTHCDID